MKAGQQPVAIGLGMKRDNLISFQLNGDAGDLAEVGRERRGGAGGGQQGVDLPRRECEIGRSCRLIDSRWKGENELWFL